MNASSPVIRFVECRSGERVATAIHGSGPLLVCPAWWVGHLELDWEEPLFRSFFTRLGEVSTVLRYDRPGVGMSSPSARARSLEGEVDRTDQLVLAGTFARGATIAPPKLRDALLDLVGAHWGAGSRALADVFLPDAAPEQREAFTRLQRTATDAATAADVLALTYAMDVSALLPGVRARTTVLHRRGDRAIAHASGHELALGIPNARLITLEGRDHPLWTLEGAGDLVAAILTNEEQLPETGCRFDRSGRCVWLDGQRVDLTPLEFGTLARLVDQAGRVVSRDDLLETVWKQPYAGSNVVDAVVRSIRSKLGRFAASVETVVGHGYRFERFRSEG